MEHFFVLLHVSVQKIDLLFAEFYLALNGLNSALQDPAGCYPLALGPHEFLFGRAVSKLTCLPLVMQQNIEMFLLKGKEVLTTCLELSR